MKSNLKPLKDLGAFDGEKYKIDLKEVKTVKCDHKQAKIINNELHCKCGVVWRGRNLNMLYDLITS